jgi:hypothetical protein
LLHNQNRPHVYNKISVKTNIFLSQHESFILRLQRTTYGWSSKVYYKGVQLYFAYLDPYHICNKDYGSMYGCPLILWNYSVLLLQNWWIVVAEQRFLNTKQSQPHLHISMSYFYTLLKNRKIKVVENLTVFYLVNWIKTLICLFSELRGIPKKNIKPSQKRRFGKRMTWRYGYFVILI